MQSKAKPVIRCSSLDTIFSCPGSRTLQPRVKQRNGGPEAWEGTYVHHQIATRLIRELGATPPPGGLPPPNVPANYRPSAQSDWLIDFAYHEAAKINADWAMEVEVPLAYEFERFILSGHHDLFAVNGTATASEGMDWKAGYIAVDPADANEQIGGYLALQKLAYPTTLDRATFSIVQPRNNEDEGDQRVSTVTVGGSDFDAIIARIERKVNAALDDATTVSSGRKQCKYCPVGIQCPAVQEDFRMAKLTLSPEQVARVTAEPDDALLGDMILLAATINAPAEAAKELLYGRLDAAPAGITAGSGVRITQSVQGGKFEVTNPVEAFKAASSELPVDELAKVISYSTTLLRDAIARLRDIPKAGNAEVTAAKIFDEKFRPHMRQSKRRILKFT